MIHLDNTHLVWNRWFLVERVNISKYMSIQHMHSNCCNCCVKMPRLWLHWENQGELTSPRSCQLWSGRAGAGTPGWLAPESMLSTPYHLPLSVRYSEKRCSCWELDRSKGFFQQGSIWAEPWSVFIYTQFPIYFSWLIGASKGSS